MGSVMTVDVRTRLEDAAGGVPSVLRAAMDALHGAIRFDHGALLLADPATFLPIAGRVEGVEDAACVCIWNAEFDDHGVDRFVDVARAESPVVSFAVEPERYRFPPEVRARLDARVPHGFDHELRVVFRVDGASHGFAHALRETPFEAAELERVRMLVRPVARALRAAAAHDARRGDASALVIVDPADAIVHATSDAMEVLGSLDSIDAVDALRARRLPAILLGLVSRARASSEGGPVGSRIRSREGLWLHATAVPLETGGHVAVTVEPAKARDLIRLAMEARRLTPREIEVASALARGLADKEIATVLGVSLHTARDHVKAVLAKCEATGRGELVAKLFLDQVLPVLEQDIVHVE